MIELIKPAGIDETGHRPDAPHSPKEYRALLLQQRRLHQASSDIRQGKDVFIALALAHARRTGVCRVLEGGTGAGGTLIRLAEEIIQAGQVSNPCFLGIDVNPVGIKSGQLEVQTKGLPVSFRRHDLREPLEDQEPFNVVGVMRVLAHLPREDSGRVLDNLLAKSEKALIFFEEAAWFPHPEGLYPGLTISIGAHASDRLKEVNKRLINFFATAHQGAEIAHHLPAMLAERGVETYTTSYHGGITLATLRQLREIASIETQLNKLVTSREITTHDMQDWLNHQRREAMARKLKLHVPLIRIWAYTS